MGLGWKTWLVLTVQTAEETATTKKKAAGLARLGTYSGVFTQLRSVGEVCCSHRHSSTEKALQSTS